MKSHYSALYGLTHAHFLAKSEQAAAASAHYVPLGVRAGTWVMVGRTVRQTDFEGARATRTGQVSRYAHWSGLALRALVGSRATRTSWPAQ